MKKDVTLIQPSISEMMACDNPICRKPKIINVKVVFKPAKTIHRPLKVFTVNGVKVEAYSRKDAITRYRHKHNN